MSRTSPNDTKHTHQKRALMISILRWTHKRRKLAFFEQKSNEMKPQTRRFFHCVKDLLLKFLFVERLKDV